MQMLLPDLGEGLVGATIAEWYVSVGDYVVEDQPLVLVETDKTDVELPSPVTGRVTRLGAECFEVLGVGGVVAEIELEAEQSSEEGTWQR